jgi:hypothetical protein
MPHFHRVVAAAVVAATSTAVLSAQLSFEVAIIRDEMPGEVLVMTTSTGRPRTERS